jgi:F0F1-type ATP synthase membrane subunit c/vacuolar-type H+-ATPase subunit K
MSKLILMSILIGMIGIPARAARAKNPRKALKSLIVQMLLFEAFYLFALSYLYGRFS